MGGKQPGCLWNEERKVFKKCPWCSAGREASGITMWPPPHLLAHPTPFWVDVSGSWFGFKTTVSHHVPELWGGFFLLLLFFFSFQEETNHGEKIAELSGISSQIRCLLLSLGAFIPTWSREKQLLLLQIPSFLFLALTTRHLGWRTPLGISAALKGLHDFEINVIKEAASSARKAQLPYFYYYYYYYWGSFPFFFFFFKFTCSLHFPIYKLYLVKHMNPAWFNPSSRLGYFLIPLLSLLQAGAQSHPKPLGLGDVWSECWDMN